MLTSLILLGLTAASTLVVAAPFPQGSFPSPIVGEVEAPVAASTGAASSSTDSTSSDAAADPSALLGQLGDLESLGGTGAGDQDIDSAPSDAFTSFDDGASGMIPSRLDLSSLLGGLGSTASSADIGENDDSNKGGSSSPASSLSSSSSPGSLGGLTSGLSGEGSLLGSSFGDLGSFGVDGLGGGIDAGAAPSAVDNTPTGAAGAGPVDNLVVAEPATSLEPVSAPSLVNAAVLAAETTTSLAADSTTTTMVADPALLAAATTTATAAPSIDIAAKFDLNEFLAGASFPAEATTAVPGIVAAAPSAA